MKFQKNALKEQFTFSTVRSATEAAERLGRSLEHRLQFKLPFDPHKLEDFGKPWVGFLIAFVLIVLRGPGWILHPQFMIEDGRFFYQNAYDMGVHSITQQYGGYYHLLPRLIALLAASLPIAAGPLVMAVGAIAVQAAVAAFLLSKRLATQIPSFGLRVLLAFMVVAYPNHDEFFANTAHSQWFLAVFGVALLCAVSGKGVLSEGVDYLAAVVVALTGPLSISFAPMAWFLAWRFRPRFERRRVVIAVIFTVAAILTVLSILAHPRLGHHGAVRAPLLMRMVSHQSFLGAILGTRFLKAQAYDPMLNFPDVVYTVLGFATIIYGCIRGSTFLRGMVLTGVFIWSTALTTDASWILLGSAGVAERYFFQLGFAFLLALAVTLYTTRWAIVRWAVRVAAVLAIVGIVWNWSYPPPNPLFSYSQQIAPWDSLPTGATLQVKTPIDRRDRQFWMMRLKKR